MSSPLFLSPRWLILKTPAWKLCSLFPEEKALVAGGCCVLWASEWRALKLREEAEGWVGKEKALGMEPPFSELRELAMGGAHKTHEASVPGSRCWKLVFQCSQTVGCTLLCGLVWKSNLWALWVPVASALLLWEGQWFSLAWLGPQGSSVRPAHQLKTQFSLSCPILWP